MRFRFDQAPNGWELRSLGGDETHPRACEFLNSQRVPVNSSERAKRQGPYPYYGANGQQGWIDDFIFDEPLVLLAEDGGFFFDPERPASYRVNGKCWVNNHAHVLRAVSDVLPDWLQLCVGFQDFTHLIPEPNRPKLNQGNARRVLIPVPPLEEQRRLVARIEALTGCLAQARQDRRAAMADAETVFQRTLEIEFSDAETEDWSEYEADELFEIVGGQVSPLDVEFHNLPYLGPEHVETGTGRIIGQRVSVAELNMKSGKHRFMSEHVVYSKIRPALRKVCTPDYPGLCSADMYVLKPNLLRISREFLKFLLLAPPFSAYAVEKSDRNAMPKINQTALRAYRFRIPETREQTLIAGLLAALLDKHAELYRLQIETEAELTAFTPALLAKAFRGEL